MKNMKKIKFGLLTLLTLVFSASFVSASTFVLSPSESTFKPGQSFSLIVSVDPQGSKVYTSKMSLTFPADILEVESFTFSNGWQALSQSGYDLVDNKSGSLIKTAGFTGGLSSKTNFGVVNFRVKKEGSAKVVVSSSSALYDENSKNVLKGNATSLFTVSTLAPEPEIKRVPVETKAVVVPKEVVSTKTEVVAEEKEEVEEKSVIVEDRLANIASPSNFSVFKDTYILLISIVVSFVLGLLVGRRTKGL